MARAGRLSIRTLLWAAIVAVLAVLLFKHFEKSDLDEAFIKLERSRRLAYARSGEPLPGTPDLGALEARLAASNLTLGVPVLVRIFKREFELEIWLRREGRFERFATYPICRWSGRLGPKVAQGDKQAPEGFYTVDAKALNSNSRWHRSFNLGFPNAFDRAHHRTGTFLMVHGGCSSAGCYAMTNPVMDEIWRLVTAALKGGQKAFQVQVYPFRMTEGNLARYSGHANRDFWESLRRGHDIFETAGRPPRVSVCRGGYVFEEGAAGDDGSARIAARCAGEGGRQNLGARRIAPINSDL